jgi:hypothetical protein
LSEKSTKFCSACGDAADADHTFCKNCGASLAETIELDSTVPLQQTETQISSEKPYVKTRIGTARVSLITGVIAFVVGNIYIINYLALVFSMFAIVFGIITLKQKEKKPGFAIGGIILGGLAIAAYIISFVFNWWYIVF